MLKEYLTAVYGLVSPFRIELSLTFALLFEKKPTNLNSILRFTFGGTNKFFGERLRILIMFVVCRQAAPPPLWFWSTSTFWQKLYYE